MQKNNWQKCFGAKRRAIDRALLADCEKEIAKEELRVEAEAIERQALAGLNPRHQDLLTQYIRGAI